jgi:predicted transcriptional regulator
MSQIVRDNRLTVRLSEDEKSELKNLADQLKLDKSATVRHALKVMSQDQTRPQSGVFTTVNQQEILIQFDHKESHDR